MNKKRPIGAIILGGIFLSAAILPILLLLLKLVDRYPTLEAFLLSIVPAFIIYLWCALIAFNKWTILIRLQKYALIAIGIQYLLLFIWGSIQIILLNKILTGFIGWLSVNFHTILSPLEMLYYKLIIFPRMVENQGAGFCFRVFYWETGLSFIFFRLLYASIIGILIAKLTDKIRHQK